MLKSGQFTIYKKVGALQVALLPPTWTTKKGTDNQFQTKTGCVLFEAAPAGAVKETWDWENKIIFALGLPDIGAIINGLEAEVSLLHDNNGVIKKMKLTPGAGQYAGTWTLNFMEDTKRVMVPITGNEMAILVTLLKFAVPAILGWDNVSPNIKEQ